MTGWREFRIHAWLPVLAVCIAVSACSRPAPPAETPPPAPAAEEKQPAIQFPIAEPPPEAPPKPVEPAPEAAPAPPPPPAPPEKRESPSPPPPQNFRVEPGMTYGQVRDLFGKDGAEITTGGRENGVMRWEKDNGGSVQVRFKDGKVLRAATQEPATAAPEEPAANLITQAQYDRVKTGMSLYEVSEFLDVEGRAVSDNGAVQIYRWQDDGGASFSAKFEQGKLTRKTTLYIPVPEPAAAEGETDGEAVGIEGADDAMPGDAGEQMAAAEGEGEIPEETPERGRMVYTRRGVYEAQSPAEARSMADERAPQTTRLGSRVVGIDRSEPTEEAGGGNVTGAARDERQRRAELPRYSHSLNRGVYEVRIVNETESSAKVGIRQGKRGRDASVPAGGQTSIYVDRGSYSLYYTLRDAPYDLGKGSITIDGQEMPDIEVRIGEDGYSAMQIDRPIYY
ncbi:MAG: hypothetical protein GC168_14100 [Candidatus Hydrogenedens sp.]|nr:hypothetical protein [Candidatus Hydrogenedens sp.]